jgi:hypothetical protein
LRSPATQAKIDAARKKTRQQRAALEISSSTGGWPKPRQKDQTGQWSGRTNQDKSAALKIRSNKDALERTTVFPLGAKPFRYAPKNNDEETQLLALGHAIAQQDKLEGDNEVTGGTKSSDDPEALLGTLEEWNFPDGTSPLSPPASENSESTNPVDYTTDNDETGLVKASDDNQENVSAGDNAIIDGLGENAETVEEISVGIKKPVLTQQKIMELIENQTTSTRTPSITSWDRKKEEFDEMFNGYESPNE